MPRFKLDFVHQGEEQVRSEEVELPLNDDGFRTALLDWGEDYFIRNNEQLVDEVAIVALEDIPEKDVKTGAIVWRDWGQFDCTTKESRLAAIAALNQFKPTWSDHGPEKGFLIEILCPEDWEVEHDGLKAEDGYIMPPKRKNRRKKRRQPLPV